MILAFGLILVNIGVHKCGHLEVDPGAPLLFVTTTAFLENGGINEVKASHYRAVRYDYRTAEERCS